MNLFLSMMVLLAEKNVVVEFNEAIK